MPLAPNHYELSQKEQAKLGLPDGLKLFSPFPFGGMNTAAGRPNVEDSEFYWRENWVRIGNGNLRTVWDIGNTLYTAPGGLSIIHFYFFNLTTTNYAMVFLSDGSAVQVRSDGFKTAVAGAGTFWAAGFSSLPACSQSGAQYLIISNNRTANDYWIWDGTILYTAGGVGPIVTITNGGSGYSSAPTVSFFGGSGTGATAVAMIDDGMVVSVQIESPGTGYLATDSVQVLFTAGGSDNAPFLTPVITAGVITSVTITAGGSGFGATAPTLTVVGGLGTGATVTCTVSGGTIDSVTVGAGGSGYFGLPSIVVQSGVNQAATADISLMPFGVSGSSIEIFQSRVWLPVPFNQGGQSNGNVFLLSAPGSLTDFATSDGGLIFTDNFSFLRARYTNIKQANGYLYPIGDSCVDIISNVQTGGNPTSTTFNYQNTDPQVGTPWRDTCQYFSRTVLFVNNFGIWGLYGGAVTRVSSKVDSLFSSAPSCQTPPTPGSLVPSSAVASIYENKAYLVLLTIKDLTTPTQTSRNVMIAWDEKDIFIVNQSMNLTRIGTQEIASDLIAWGTDGTKLAPLLTTPNPTLQKRLVSKLYGGDTRFITKQPYFGWAQIQDQGIPAQGVNITVTWDTEALSSPPFSSGVMPAPIPTYPIVGIPVLPGADVSGNCLGFTVTSFSPDFEILDLSLGYKDVSALFGENSAQSLTG